MKKEELKDKIKTVEPKEGTVSYNTNETITTHHLAELTKIYIEIINDFNMSAEKYNKRLLWYTIAIAILTFIMAILTVILVWKAFIIKS